MNESLILADESFILADESLILADESFILADESLILADESLILADESFILADESLILADESLILADESLILADESLNSTLVSPCPLVPLSPCPLVPLSPCPLVPLSPCPLAPLSPPMKTWQVDFYRRPSQDASGQILWDLLICDATRSFEYEATCLQSAANSNWVATQLKLAAGEELPDVIQVFRPQSLSLIEAAGRNLSINVEPTRHTLALKQWLQEKQYPATLDKPPPAPLPENLWGEQWRFASLAASDVETRFSDRPIPILHIPEHFKPINLGLASTVPVPGVVIYGGRQSMRLARWLQQARPVSFNYISGAPDGLILEASLVDRWIVATFEDPEVTTAAQAFEQRKKHCRGLHFLLVQPDDSGMTYSGFWLLQAEN